MSEKWDKKYQKYTTPTLPFPYSQREVRYAGSGAARAEYVQDDCSPAMPTVSERCRDINYVLMTFNVLRPQLRGIVRHRRADGIMALQTYEQSMRAPLGRDTNTEAVFREATRPAVLKQTGQIIQPLQLNSAALEAVSHKRKKGESVTVIAGGNVKRSKRH